MELMILDYSIFHLNQSSIFAKIVLGRIRSRIGNPPGPNGGVQLDGPVILAEGLQEKKDWEERLLVRFGDLLGPRMM